MGHSRPLFLYFWLISTVDGKQMFLSFFFLSLSSFYLISFFFLSLFKMGHSRPLFLYFHLISEVDSKQMFNIIFCQWLDSNRRPLVLEATALPIEPQLLPLSHSFFLLAFFFVPNSTWSSSCICQFGPISVFLSWGVWLTSAWLFFRSFLLFRTINSSWVEPLLITNALGSPRTQLFLLKMGHPQPLFRLFSSLQTNIKFLQHIDVKKYGVGIQTYGLQYMSLLP